jgi:hypothetical protein
MRMMGLVEGRRGGDPMEFDLSMIVSEIGGKKMGPFPQFCKPWDSCQTQVGKRRIEAPKGAKFTPGEVRPESRILWNDGSRDHADTSLEVWKHMESGHPAWKVLDQA